MEHCEKCKPIGSPGKIGTPWCGKMGNCSCHMENWKDEFDKKFVNLKGCNYCKLPSCVHYFPPSNIKAFISSLLEKVIEDAVITTQLNHDPDMEITDWVAVDKQLRKKYLL